MVENQRRRVEISEDLGSRRQAFGQQSGESLKETTATAPAATKIIKDVASRTNTAAATSGRRDVDRGRIYNFFSGFLRKLPWIVGLLALSIGLLGYLMSPPSKVTINGRSLPTPPGTWLASGKYGIPLIGDTIEAMLSPFLFTERRFQKYGNASSATVLGNNLYLMNGVEAMKIFYNQDLVTREGAFYSHFIIGMGGKILNMLAGDEYSERREVIMHSVADMKVVNSFIPTAKTFITKYLKKWSNYDKSFIMKDEAHRLNAELALNFVLDLNTIGDSAEVSQNLQLVDKIVEWNSDVLNGLQAPPIPLPGTWFYRALSSTRKARELYYEVLDKRMNELKDVDPRSSPETVTPMDRMALLMKKAKADSKHGLVTEIHHMMLAAEALIGNAMTDMMLAFSLYPEVWRKAKFEVMKEIPTLEDVTNWREALDRLKYVDAVSLETRRLFPFVPGMLGKAKKDIEFQGYAIPKGSTVAGLFFTTLHDPAEWTNPYEFNPERFLSGEPKSRELYWAWVPQGTSYHQCPGINFTDQTLKMFVVLLSHFDCSWNFPTQDYKQNMYLFNPEPKSGLILENFSCSKL